MRYLRILTGSVLLVALAVITSSFKTQRVEIVDSCNKDEQVLNAKKKLSPFKYDTIKTLRMTNSLSDQVRELEVPLLSSDSQYRFVISGEGMPDEVKVEIWDKTRDQKKATKIFEGSTSSEKILMHELAEGTYYNRVYVYFIVPADANFEPTVQKKGCITFLAGYKVI